MKSKILFAAKSVFTAMIIALASFSSETKAAEAVPNHSEIQASRKIPFILNIAAEERRVFELVNNEREKNGLSRLVWNFGLAQLARKYSEQMADERFFGHFDRNGMSVEDRADAMRIRGWRKIGENLFVCSGTTNFTSLAVQKWMKSPTHRRNILDAEWTAAGIGVAVSDRGEIYATQVFIGN